MRENERSRLLDLTITAISINKQLMSEEKEFATMVANSSDINQLEELCDSLSDLIAKEHLYLKAAQSLLQNIKMQSHKV